jgi:SAM-dependent methyltransferase
MLKAPARYTLEVDPMAVGILRKRRQIIQECPRLAEHYVDTFEFDASQLLEWIGSFQGARVLDVGCGLTYPHVIIFQCLGADVTGIDIDVIDPRDRVRSVFRLAARQGILRTLRDCTVASVTIPALKAEMLKRMEIKTDIAHVPDVREGDALAMAFPDNTFDLIYSHAVYEHIPDIGRALDEARRALKPGGILRLGIHLFASLTGGHTGKVGRDGENVPPWDHLRNRLYPPTSFLNELREGDFRREAESRFEILNWIPCKRAQDLELLTDGLEDELAAKGYARDELITETIVIHARKTTPDPVPPSVQ